MSVTKRHLAGVEMAGRWQQNVTDATLAFSRLQQQREY